MKESQPDDSALSLLDFAEQHVARTSLWLLVAAKANALIL